MPGPVERTVGAGVCDGMTCESCLRIGLRCRRAAEKIGDRAFACASPADHDNVQGYWWLIVEHGADAVAHQSGRQTQSSHRSRLFGLLAGVLLQPTEVVGQLARQRSRRQRFHIRSPLSAFRIPLSTLYGKTKRTGNSIRNARLAESGMRRAESGFSDRDGSLPMVSPVSLREALPSSPILSPEKVEYRNESVPPRGTNYRSPARYPDKVCPQDFRDASRPSSVRRWHEPAPEQETPRVRAGRRRQSPWGVRQTRRLL